MEWASSGVHASRFENARLARAQGRAEGRRRREVPGLHRVDYRATQATRRTPASIRTTGENHTGTGIKTAATSTLAGQAWQGRLAYEKYDIRRDGASRASCRNDKNTPAGQDAQPDVEDTAGRHASSHSDFAQSGATACPKFVDAISTITVGSRGSSMRHVVNQTPKSTCPLPPSNNPALPACRASD